MYSSTESPHPLLRLKVWTMTALVILSGPGMAIAAMMPLPHPWHEQLLRGVPLAMLAVSIIAQCTRRQASCARAQTPHPVSRG